MNVSCLQENLSKGLGIVGRAVAPRSTLPVLSHVLLATDGDRLKLSATNLETGVVCWLGAKVEEGGAITVPARLLTDYVATLPQERVDMATDDKAAKLGLKCANSEANIKGMPAEEMPIVPEAVDAGSNIIVSLSAAELCEALRKVIIATATDEGRPILTGVLFKFTERNLTLAAADGYRLSVVENVAFEAEKIHPSSVIVPAGALGELLKLAKDIETIRLGAVADSRVTFELGDVTLSTTLIKGKFPDYTSIIPKAHTTRTVVSTGDFLKAVKMANIFARNDAFVAKVEIAPAADPLPGRVILKAATAEYGDSEGEIDAQVDGDGLILGFNTKHLIDALSVMDGGHVVLETTTSSDAAVLRPVGEDGFTHVLMPMHLSK